jgi:predicted amino acid racemase
MFLRTLLDRNPAFVEAAVRLQRDGRVPANSYLFDLEAIRANATVLATEADRWGLQLFAMTKQVGRNPDVLRALMDAGVDHAVAVDMACARIVVREGMDLGHLGHLVQVPRHEAGAAADLQPANWTVFNDVKAAEAAAAARARGTTQDLLARIQAPGDTFYSGHEGGYEADEIEAVAARLDALDGGRFAGITTFPALLYDADAQDVRPTPNLTTLARAARRLGDGVRVNAPGTTSSTLLPVLAEHGATQVEPGHAFTGTTPLHVVRELPERPAALYVSEISHHHGDRAYFFGGGTYVDPVFGPYQVRALAGGRLLDAELPPPSAIDYYGQLRADDGPLPAVGEPVVLGFRIQAFVTRAYTVGIDGVSTGDPQPLGIYTASGDPTGWPA